MTKVSPVGGAAPATPVTRPAEAAPSAAAGAVAGTASTLPVPQLVAAAFERLRGVGPTPGGRPLAEVVREAVADTLAQGLPALAAPARARLADQIGQVLMDDPTLRARLERLVGTPA